MHNSIDKAEGAPQPPNEPELPEFFRSADTAAVGAQQRYLRLSAIQLVLLLIAAGAGVEVAGKEAGENLGWPQLVTASAFLTAALVRSHVLATKSESVWYQTRAAAEAAKSLAWRYVSGGDPFRIDLTVRQADEQFLEHLRSVRDSLDDVPVPMSGSLDQITERMRIMRGGSLQERMATYRTYRLDEESSWYRARAASKDRAARRWNAATVCLEIVGAIGALLAAVGPAGLGRLPGFSGLAATAVGAATTWNQTRQHRSLASSYASAARELGDIGTLMSRVESENQWARCIDRAEGAISREHALWSSSRSH